MKNVAVFDGGTVSNIILCADDYVLSDNEIEYQDSNPAIIGGDYVGGFFYPPQPYPSWTRSSGKWVSPVPFPSNMREINPDNKPVVWNEDEQKWIILQ